MNGHAPLFHTTIVHGKLTQKKKKKLQNIIKVV